jgi:hypothetical protein
VVRSTPFERDLLAGANGRTADSDAASLGSKPSPQPVQPIEFTDSGRYRFKLKNRRRELTERIGLSIGADGRVPGVGAAYANSGGDYRVTTHNFQCDLTLAFRSELTPYDNRDRHATLPLLSSASTISTTALSKSLMVEELSIVAPARPAIRRSAAIPYPKPPCPLKKPHNPVLRVMNMHGVATPSRLYSTVAPACRGWKEKEGGAHR